jgi:hypothetical protein
VATQILLYRFQAHDDPAGSFASGCAARSVLLRARAALSPTNHRLSAGGVPSPAGLVLACPARDQRPCRSRRARALGVEHWRCATYDGPTAGRRASRSTGLVLHVLEPTNSADRSSDTTRSSHAPRPRRHQTDVRVAGGGDGPLGGTASGST